MASFVYNTAAKELLDEIYFNTDVLKIMLVTSSYVANRDDDVVDAGGANDAIDHELNGVSGYTRGWGGAGRKTAVLTHEVDKTNDRAEIDIADLTWTALGTGATIAAAILIKEGGANDTTSRLIAYFDITDTPTNGGDITLDFDAVEGAIRLSTV